METENNPYASPAEAGSKSRDARAVGHVRAVAILLIVQGFLECLMGVLMAGLTIVSLAAPTAGGTANAVIAVMIYVGFALIGLVIGGTRVYAGVRNLYFRSHTFGIVSLALGLATVVTCWCAPTSIALTIYGLIIYLNPFVAEAFAMGERGAEPEAIVAHFSHR